MFEFLGALLIGLRNWYLNLIPERIEHSDNCDVLQAEACSGDNDERKRERLYAPFNSSTLTDGAYRSSSIQNGKLNETLGLALANSHLCPFPENVIGFDERREYQTVHHILRRGPERLRSTCIDYFFNIIEDHLYVTNKCIPLSDIRKMEFSRARKIEIRDAVANHYDFIPFSERVVFSHQCLDGTPDLRYKRNPLTCWLVVTTSVISLKDGATVSYDTLKCPPWHDRISRQDVFLELNTRFGRGEESDYEVLN